MKRFLNTLLFLLLHLPSLLFGQMQGAATSTPTQFTPILFLDFTKGSMPNGGVYSRSSIGTYYNSSGVLTTASANTARFDYDPVTLQAKGILLEESRTNQILQSAAFDNVAWAKSNVTVTPNNDIAPDGTMSADLLSFAGTNGAYCQQSTGVTSGTTYTFSFFAKGTQIVSRTDGALGGGSGSGIVFNLTNGTFTNASGQYTNVIITYVGSGFYRCSFSKTAGETGSGTFAIDNPNGFYTSVAGSCTLWGAQVEQGSSVTSYIPTTTTNVPRSADNLSFPLNGYNKNLVTIYCEFQSGFIYSLNYSSSSDEIQATGGAGLSVQIPDAITGYPNLAATTLALSGTANSVIKSVLRARAGTAGAQLYSGGNVTTSNLLNMPTKPTNLYLGRTRNSAFYSNGYFRKVIIYPNYLPDDYCKKLSQ